VPNVNHGRPLSLSVCVAGLAVAFLAVGLVTATASWSGHFATSVGLLLAAVGLGFVACRFHAGRLTETIDNLTLWGVLAGTAGTASGSLAATGTGSDWRFVLGSLVAALLIGGLRWWAVVSSSRR
jgi:hypothetical protein